MKPEQTVFEKAKTPSRKAQRLPSSKRASPELVPGFRLTPRDRELLWTVYEYRALTTPQIERLLFPPEKGQSHPTKTSRCRHRLKLLYHAGFLARAEQPFLLSEGRKPFVYFLDEKGAQFLAAFRDVDRDEIDWHPRDNNISSPFLEHLLSTNDVRIAVTLSAQKHNYAIATWLDDKTLKERQMKDYVMIKGPEGGEKKAAVVPDGFFTLEVGNRVGNMFLEIDLATVTGESSIWGRRTYGRKIAAFLAYYRSGKYQERYHSQSMRVLTVTTGDTRLQNLKAITEKTGGKSRFWLTTFARIKDKDVLTDPIWNVAGREGLFSVVETRDES